MIQRPRLFTDYNELPDIIDELETLATDLKSITVLQHDEKKNWELDEAYEEIIRACRRLMKVCRQPIPTQNKDNNDESN